MLTPDSNCLKVTALLLMTFWLCGCSAIVTPESPATSTSLVTPTPLYTEADIFAGCAENTQLSRGPTWRNITIGTTHIEDIEELYGVRFSPYISFRSGVIPNRRFVTLTMTHAFDVGLPQYAEVCITNTKIALLHLSSTSYSETPHSFLSDWVQIYGEPEFVTWAMTGNDWRFRTAVWHTEGIILDIDASATLNDPSIALVVGITLAPFWMSEDFLSEWPYSNLPTEPPTSVNQGFPTEQNPFNFGAMIPTFTPTATR